MVFLLKKNSFSILYNLLTYYYMSTASVPLGTMQAVIVTTMRNKDTKNPPQAFLPAKGQTTTRNVDR